MLGRTVNVGAGQRDKLVTIESRTNDSADSGFPTETWATLTSVYMSREDSRADERIVAAHESAFIQTRWQMVYMESMDPESVNVPAERRLRYRGRIYDILAASLLERRIGIELETLAQT